MTADHGRSVRVRVLLVVVLVGALIAMASSEAIHETVLRALDRMRTIMTSHPLAGSLGFVALAALSAMLAFFSSAVLVPAAVHAWGPLVTALLLWTGWILGGLVAYSLASYVGRPALRWVAASRDVAVYEERLRRRATFGSVLLFQLALPSEIPGYVLGLVRYPLPRYLAALAIAELPYAVGTMLLGAGFVARRVGLLMGIGVAAVAAVLVLAWAVRRRVQ